MILNIKFDIIVLTEAWVDRDRTLVALDGYEVQFAPCNSHKIDEVTDKQGQNVENQIGQRKRPRTKLDERTYHSHTILLPMVHQQRAQLDEAH
ncbi:hypothetical protein J6590_090740 [Homalodisca vitripennis]|nr:hypothetical protein J6590_090740 [Homalodisca vitripennis]